jgi:uncharacterized protein YciI
MLFAINAVFKPNLVEDSKDYGPAFNEHLSQTIPRVRLAARVLSPSGAETGIFVILDAADQAAARTFLDSSPYQKADLYQTCTINALDVEVGTLN